tara:strand:- start:16592 stop:17074 length:483 start_codon:yes stop_codon:yes gene_type:complete
MTEEKKEMFQEKMEEWSQEMIEEKRRFTLIVNDLKGQLSDIQKTTVPERFHQELRDLTNHRTNDSNRWGSIRSELNALKVQVEELEFGESVDLKLLMEVTGTTLEQAGDFLCCTPQNVSSLLKNATQSIDLRCELKKYLIRKKRKNNIDVDVRIKKAIGA